MAWAMPVASVVGRQGAESANAKVVLAAFGEDTEVVRVMIPVKKLVVAGEEVARTVGW